jgi:nitroimidazol reductase NimA-like FMN-containing flavoprotein (pyridoxamine 5'-phosphate oxidase superfamily)
MELTELSVDDSWHLLEQAHVGRVALIRGGLPSILPVNICALDSGVYFRTGPGALLDAAIAGDIVSVEADEVDLAWHSGWSVVVSGHAQVVADDPNVPVTAWARSDADHVVRIEAEVVTGRKL